MGLAVTFRLYNKWQGLQEAKFLELIKVENSNRWTHILILDGSNKSTNHVEATKLQGMLRSINKMLTLSLTVHISCNRRKEIKHRKPRTITKAFALLQEVL